MCYEQWFLVLICPVNEKVSAKAVIFSDVPPTLQTCMALLRKVCCKPLRDLGRNKKQKSEIT